MAHCLSVGTKCSIPRLPEALVRRPRLEGLLGSDARRQVTLISAPPGAGKTTLLASWLASASVGPVAWLTVDERDMSGHRLAELVAVALGRVCGLDADALRDTRVPASGDEVLDNVFEQLMRSGERCVLVLDDVQEAAGGKALRTLARIVEQAPPTLDVVMAARADPPLGWGRLRLQGRLRQVRNDDLRFRPDEAAELFAGHGVRIGRDDTRVLCDRTEGWAAGLRLAACALQSDAEPGRLVLSASATQVAVSDYLLTEVLDRQDEAAQRFLLRTSVVDRLTPDLARALTGDARAGERLAALERRGIFLVQLEEDGSYRYHALFAALLRARLRLRDPELVAALHRRAAGWHLAHGLPVEAEFHARAAGEWYMVGRLVLDRWLAAAVDARPLAGGATDGVPPVVTMGTPELALVAAAQACRQRNRRDADRYRHVVDRVSATAPDRVSSWSTARDVLDVEYGRAFGAGARELHAARRLADDPRAGVLTPRARRLGDLRRAELDLDGGRVERAQRALGRLVDDPEAGPVRTEAAAVLSVVGATAGDLETAQALASTVLAAAAADAPDQGSVEATDAARLALALCHLQRAEHRLAGDVLDGMAGGTLPCRSIEAVHRAVTAARQRRSSGPVVLDVPGAEDPLLGAALSALGVVEIADTKGRPRLHGGPGENRLAAARRSLAGQGTGPAADLLDAWLDLPAGADGGSGPVPRAHPRTLIEATLLSALLAADGGDEALARRRLEEAVELLDASGVRAPFVLHAERVVPLLERHAGEMGTHRSLAVALLDRLAHDMGSLLPIEALTDRELEVLHHLPTLMSNVEIAAGMHVSVNTVKTHLKAVYRKLGVDGRRQAVLRGRELELI